MTNTTQKIQDIENRWWELVQNRHKVLQAALEAAPKNAFHSVVQAHNKDQVTEALFDALEEELRQLDPDNLTLPENNHYLY